jgi:hypothetical protein
MQNDVQNIPGASLVDVMDRFALGTFPIEGNRSTENISKLTPDHGVSI